jgi:ATP-dependent DNA ligase
VCLRLLSPAFLPPLIARRLAVRWLHEIKLDGFRMMVRRDPAGVRLLTRNGYDWTGRFPRIAAAAETLRARSFLIDGEAVACDGDGLPVFDRLRYRNLTAPNTENTENTDRLLILYSLSRARLPWKPEPCLKGVF